MNTQNPDNILFIHQGHELYGSDKSLLRNIRALKQKFPAARISVVLPGEGSLADYIREEFNIEPQFLKLGVLRKYDLKRFNFNIIPRVLICFRYISLMNRFDLVHINSLVVMDMIIAARFSKARKMIHIREIPTGIQRVFFKALLSFSHAELVFISNAVKRSFGRLRNPIQHVVWNGTHPVPELSEEVISQEEHTGFLLIGRINAWKGQPLLVEALALLPPREKERVKATILGDVYGKENYRKYRIKKLIEKHKLTAMVVMVPFTPNPENYYHNADAVIVPSIHPEPFGLVAIEAMSAGKPVIAANHGGLTEIVVHNETGILFEPGNPKALAEALSFAINNPEKMKQMGEAGRKRYEEHFTEEIYIRNFQEIV